MIYDLTKVTERERERERESSDAMAEVLVFCYTAIRDWVPNLLIALWAGVVLGGALQYLVFRQIVIRGRFLRVIENFITTHSFRANGDEWLASSSRCILPEDLLIDEILSRLSVKSLMRFKSVCKRWQSLPTNPSFIASHLKHSNTCNMLSSWNSTKHIHTINMMSSWNRRGLVVGHEGFHVFTLCSHYFIFQPINLNFGFDRKPHLVLGPCHGLFCLYWMPPTFCRQVGPLGRWLPSIALWNPATRAFSILPMSKLGLPPYNAVHCRLVGFGFDLVTKCIKVVKVVKFDEATDYEFKNCAEVYDLGSGSWRVLDVDDTLQEVFLSDQPINDMCMYNNNDGVFHWDSYGNFCGDIKRHVSLVLSFDMCRELFHVTLMPKKYDKWGAVYYFSLLRDSLAVNFSFLKAGHNTTEIWVMKKDLFHGIEAGESFSSYSWSHELTVELPAYLGPCFAMGFLSKNELLLWKIEWGLTPFLYDIVTKQARNLGAVKFIYKESLVPVKGGCGNNSIPKVSIYP